MKKTLPFTYYASQPFYRFLAVGVFLLPAMVWSIYCVAQRTILEQARTKTAMALWKDSQAEPRPDIVPIQAAIQSLIKAREKGAESSVIQARLDAANSAIHTQCDPLRGAIARNEERAKRIGLIAEAARAEYEAGFLNYMLFPPDKNLAKYR